MCVYIYVFVYIYPCTHTHIYTYTHMHTLYLQTQGKTACRPKRPNPRRAAPPRRCCSSGGATSLRPATASGSPSAITAPAPHRSLASGSGPFRGEARAPPAALEGDASWRPLVALASPRGNEGRLAVGGRPGEIVSFCALSGRNKR